MTERREIRAVELTIRYDPEHTYYYGVGVWPEGGGGILGPVGPVSYYRWYQLSRPDGQGPILAALGAATRTGKVLHKGGDVSGFTLDESLAEPYGPNGLPQMPSTEGVVLIRADQQT